MIRNRRLNALVTDLDLPVDPAALAMQPWDRQEVHTLFDGLEFRVLRERLFETVQSLNEEEIDESGFEMSGVVLEPDAVAAWLADQRGRAGRGHRAGHAGGPARARCARVALAAADGSAAWVDAATVTPADDAALGAWLADPKAPKVMHDAKGPLLALAARGWQLDGLVSDTALAAYLVRPDQRTFDLADLTLRYLKRELKQGGPRR